MNPRGGYQPFRRSPERGISPVLSAMLAGKPFFTRNPIDAQRELQRRRLSAMIQMQLSRHRF